MILIVISFSLKIKIWLFNFNAGMGGVTQKSPFFWYDTDLEQKKTKKQNWSHTLPSFFWYDDSPVWPLYHDASQIKKKSIKEWHQKSRQIPIFS